jgi:hypothetical protein
MRALLVSSLLSVLTLLPTLGHAGPVTRQVQVSDSEKTRPADSGYKSYRGYVYDLSENAGRPDSVAMADGLLRQLDIVESVGLSPQVLTFFHKVPIIANEMSCLEKLAAAACYGANAPRREQGTRGFTVWDSQKAQWINSDAIALAEDIGTGIVMIRPSMMRHAQDPVMLHEFLHAYHAQLLPNGFRNEGVLGHYNSAKSKQLYATDTYALTNEREFFAVTASIFLYGKDSAHEPFTRADLKEKQPDYYKYLVGLFGFDPDRAVTPVASAN